jgi:hypothetical protein
MPSGDRKPNRPSVSLRIEAEQVSRFNVGTRWEVVAASQESLWQGAHTITFREIVSKDDEKSSAGGDSSSEG